MKKFLSYLVVVLVILAASLRISLEFEGPQDTALEQAARAMMNALNQDDVKSDSLRVFICGSASPLGAGAAQACVAVLTPQHFYLFDSGAGSTANITANRLPTARLRGIFLTHFHSDHIAEIPEVNLNSWVQGRPEPLRIYGPKGVRRVVGGINETYALDTRYRVAHHGTELLPPELGVLQPQKIEPGVVLEDGDLTVTAYVASHSPIEPAVGYRVDYRGRSVVISGDSLVTDDTKAIIEDADLLLHDALSYPLVTAMADAAENAGINRAAKIMRDVLDYHASTDSINALADDIDMIAYYHLVPNPSNLVMRKFFERGMPDNVVIAGDGDWFELPIDSDEIVVVLQ